jgi:alpha-1,3-rhamnosyl/mannosyltransferase
MVIGFDAREAGQARPDGKGRYAREMLVALPQAAPKHQFRMYVREIPHGIRLPKNASWEVISGTGLAWHRRAARAANREADYYFATSSYLTPQFLTIPYLLVVFDLISFQSFQVAQRRARRIERLLLGRAGRRAAAIVTISAATARDLKALFPRLVAPVTVTPLAADARFGPNRRPPGLAKRHRLPKSFILTTGTIEPRKNLERLAEAYRGLPADLRERYGLVVVGRPGWQTEPILAALREAARSGRVRHLTAVNDRDLAGLYAACTIFCYPSLYEGFGLPVLEAMQAGAPVITSRFSSLPEVGGEAARYIDPSDTAALTAALAELLRDVAARRQMAARGRRRAKEFSWKRTAKLTAEAING